MPATPDSTVPRSRGAILRRLVADGTVAIPGAPLALAAKLIEREGFDAIYLSGAAFSAGLLGVPDIGILTLDQLVAQTRLLAATVEIPLVVDADTGFGGPDAVAECVRRLEEAGAAAIQLEDQRRPKRCGHLPGKEIVEVDEMTAKIAAACAARVTTT
jgi:methylisocitrate lyase